MRRICLAAALIALFCLIAGVLETPSAQAIPSCNALDFQPCTTLYQTVTCGWTSGAMGACQCRPYINGSKVWMCYLTGGPA